MINIEKQVEYWREGSKEDWDVADDLVKRGKIRHGLFFAHLAVEKALKAIVSRETHDIPPRIHDLLRLAEIAGISLEQHQVDLLSDVSNFNLTGRYPRSKHHLPPMQEAQSIMRGIKETLEWLDEMC